MIYVGTSGYSYPGWRGTFYPTMMGRKEMLPFYATRFPAVELNFTYYGIPHPTVFERMIKETPAGFLFAVKLNGRITHEKDTEAMYEFSEAVSPLRESGRLCALLAQFPHRFNYSGKHVKYLTLLKRMFPEDELVIEFRNSGWVRSGVFEFLNREGMGFCCVDEPEAAGLLPPVAKATSTIGYVRFHSRSAENWYGNVGKRYDYRYSKGELFEWVPRIRALADEVEKIYIFFNNCHAGHAALNAYELQEMLLELGFDPQQPGPAKLPATEELFAFAPTPK